MIHMFKFNSQSPIIKDSQTLWSGERERKIISKSMFGFEVEGEERILEAD